MTGMFDKMRHLGAGALGLLAACSPHPAGFLEARGEPAQKLAEDPKVFLLDVRTKEEWDDARLKNATLVPITELQGRLAELPSDKDRPILIYCAVGGRSARAAQLLTAKGYKNVVNLGGGINAWLAEGRPVVR
jgi:phage shock protein E